MVLQNFPHLFNVSYDENYAYFVEGFMGFNLKYLFEICENKFDLITVINIGIDLIKNIKIMHENCFNIVT